jgi:hypothetical protein
MNTTRYLAYVLIFLKINLTCSIFTNVYIYNISRVIDM